MLILENKEWKELLFTKGIQLKAYLENSVKKTVSIRIWRKN
jgi:hypothetical protein